ncbi:MAG: hypothetical protein WAL98_05375 [Desulfatiglandaceae bacterium]
MRRSDLLVAKVRAIARDDRNLEVAPAIAFSPFQQTGKRTVT